MFKKSLTVFISKFVAKYNENTAFINLLNLMQKPSAKVLKSEAFVLLYSLYFVSILCKLCSTLK